MKNRFAIVLLSVLLTACGLSGSTSTRSEQRYFNKDRGYSVDQPNGWSPSIVRGSAQFAPTGNAKTDKNKKHTIVVRAADKPRELKEGKATTNDDVIAATEKVLRAMPRAKVGDQTKLEGTDLPGARFSMTFVPRGLSTTYRRDHVVLIGSKHVYHVIFTGPADEPVDEAAFKSIVTTLSEEG